MGDPEWSFPEPEAKWEPNRGENAKPARAAIRTAAWQGKKGSVLPPPSPARPPRPRASASRRRKCCVAHFRVLSGRRRRRRASPVSRPPPPPQPPRVPEPGATSPPWPASKVGLGRRAPEGWVAARERGRGPWQPPHAASPARAPATEVPELAAASRPSTPASALAA